MFRQPDPRYELAGAGVRLVFVLDAKTGRLLGTAGYVRKRSDRSARPGEY